MMCWVAPRLGLHLLELSMRRLHAEAPDQVMMYWVAVLLVHQKTLLGCWQIAAMCSRKVGVPL